MMTLDQRARQAAESVHETTAAYYPRGGVADVARRQVRRRAAGVAMAGLAVFAALVAGTWFAGTPEEEVAESPTPSIPAIDGPAPENPVTPLPPTPGDEVTPATRAPIPDETPTPLPGDSGQDPGTVALPPVTEPPVTTAPPVTRPPAPATTVLVDTAPPVLAITFPQPGETLDRKTIRFTGTTEPGSTVTAGKYEADVDGEGNWSIVLVLSEGGNRALFRATDAAGNEATEGITVYYEKPVEDPPPPPSVEFTAHATYGSCSFDPPYDVYYGTADPESKITILSEFGGGTTHADAEGNWELKVYFPEAPSGVPFRVTVKDQSGTAKKFEFVSLVGA